jgi:shikimate 5-dehydrogenase
MDPATAAAISGAGGAAVGAAATWRKLGRESESIAVTTLRSVIAELRAELDRKETEMGVMRAKLDVLDLHLTALADTPPGHLA